MTTIGVCAPSFAERWKATFGLLGKALDVSFEGRALSGDPRIDGWIVLGADRTVRPELDRISRPCYVVPDHTDLAPAGSSCRITFEKRAELPAVLRGREVTADDAVAARGLPDWVSDAIPLALKDHCVIWAIRERSGCRHHYVALAPPELTEADALLNHFSGLRIARVLPLVLFVRSITQDINWEPPPLQATFMFDDPNLHGGSYGFIDYRELLGHASVSNYHVSVATIPLDSWFVHRPTRDIFRQNARWISLLCHGNDHVSNELARPEPAEAVHRMLLQAVGRIAAMEARTGLEVARVMAPPHGACSEKAIAEMARIGFEALCVSRGSLHYHNSGASWTRTIGVRPCDMVAGLPVIPRFGLSRNCCNDVLIAALLGQPIVPVTHHHALAGGYELVDELASYINSLGQVHWRDMTSISRSMYSQRQHGTTTSVEMLSRRISCLVREGTSQIQVGRPWLADEALEPLFWRGRTDETWRLKPCSEPIPVQAGATIEMASGQAVATSSTAGRVGRPHLVPLARRLLAEARDRALPSMYHIVRHAG